MTKGETKFVINQSLNTKRGFVFGINMVPVLNQVDNNTVETKKMIKNMSVETTS
jgi:hypothetical protein